VGRRDRQSEEILRKFESLDYEIRRGSFMGLSRKDTVSRPTGPLDALNYNRLVLRLSLPVRRGVGGRRYLLVFGGACMHWPRETFGQGSR